MADQKIPYEFQTDFGQIGELERIAELMQQQRLMNQKNMGGQMVSGHFVRMSPMQGLADMFAAYQGGKARTEAGRLRTELPQRMDAAEKGQLGKMAALMTGRPEQQEPTPEWGFGPGEAKQLPAVAANPLEAARLGEASQFPRVQAMGKALSETVRNQTSAFAPQLTPAGLQYMAQYGTVPPRQPGMWKPDAEYTDVGPIPGTEGRVDATTGKTLPPILGQQNKADKSWKKIDDSPLVKVDSTVRMGEQADWEMLGKEFEHLYGKEGTATARKTVQNLQKIGSAMDLFATAPVNTGVDSDWLTFAQSLGKLTGKEVPKNVPATQLYNSFIVPMVGQVITAFGSGTGLSDADREFAQTAVALAKNDPRMIPIALAYALRAEMTEAQYYNDRVEKLTTEAVRKGKSPEFYNRPINFKVRFDNFQKAFGMPDNLMEPGKLEEWASKVLNTSPLDSAVQRYLKPAQ